MSSGIRYWETDLPWPWADDTFTYYGGTGASNPSLLEGGVIHHHPGISGGADLVPSVHGWDDPVVRIRITRVA